MDVVIDAELGILLRCEQSGGGEARVLEFARLEAAMAVDEALYAPPPGSRVVATDAAARDLAASAASVSVLFPWLAPEPAAAPARPAVRRLAGLAAGGLGALLRFTPVKPPAPPGRSEPGDGARIPGDDPPPAGPGQEGPVSDEILALLYRAGGAASPRFTATLHTWVSGAGVLAGLPDAAREPGLGGARYLAETIARDGDVTTHEVRAARIDGWHRYRIEREPGPAAGRGAGGRAAARIAGPGLIACNGMRYWEVRADRVTIDDPRPALAELADLADPSWLLGCELSGGEALMVAGRPAYRLTVRGRRRRPELLTMGLPAVGVLDAASGRLLRLTSFGGGVPAVRHELCGVTEAAAGAERWDFAFDVPAGLRVVRAGAGDDRPTAPLRIARDVARSGGGRAARRTARPARLGRPGR